MAVTQRVPYGSVHGSENGMYFVHDEIMSGIYMLH